MKRLPLRAVMVAALALSLAACGGGGAAGESGEFTTVTDGCITVAFPEGSLPRIATTADGGLGGFEGVLLTEVAERHDLDLCPFPTDFASSILAVDSGQADVAVSVYYTEERAQQFHYTRPNVYDRLTFLMDDSIDYTGPESLKDLRAASISFWTYTPHMEEFWGEQNMTYAPGQTELFEMIRGGQIDVTIGGGAGPTALEGADPDSGLRAVPLEEGDLGIPEEIRTSPSHMIVNCANPGLAEAIDAVLVEMTESGRWAEVLTDQGLTDESIIVPESVGQPEQLCA